jgi:hypothetical protein
MGRVGCRGVKPPQARGCVVAIGLWFSLECFALRANAREAGVLQASSAR